MSPAGAVARAVVKSIRNDKAEMVIMPGPGRLMRAQMALFPGMGPMMNQRGGVARLMKQVAEFREREHTQVDASAHYPAEQR
jgi:hypothetical protein